MLTRIALIAGGTGEVGLAIARRLHADGLRVAVQGPLTLWDKNVAELNDFIFIGLDPDDFTDEAVVRALSELTWVYRHLDVLVTVSAPEATLPAALARHAGPMLGARGEGRLLHVTLGGAPQWPWAVHLEGGTVNCLHADVPSGTAREVQPEDVAGMVSALVQPGAWCVSGAMLHVAGR